MEAARSSKRISVSQQNYVLDLLHEIGKPIETPMGPNNKVLPQLEELATDKGQYWES